MITYGTYNQPTDKEQQIIALTAKLEQVAEKTAEMDQKLAAFASRNHKNKNGTSKNQGKKANPKWMLQQPTKGKLTMIFAGEMWTWSPVHKKWGNHKEANCYLKKKLQNQASKGKTAHVAMETAVAQAAITMYDSNNCNDNYC